MKYIKKLYEIGELSDVNLAFKQVTYLFKYK